VGETNAEPVGGATILAWETDPGAPDAPNDPVRLPVPDLNTTRLRFAITGEQPPAAEYRQGTEGFRYWAAASSLRRASDVWSDLVPPTRRWFTAIGDELDIVLDDGARLSADYDRRKLGFFSETVNSFTVYSAESPDVVCHEFAHAVLDALRPDLYHTASVEVAAFHESFGDISAILSALKLESVREALLIQTNNEVYRASPLSRLGEQFGWAIRQVRPDLAERDCFRNAVNSFFYRDPATLPPVAPAAQLSSEPHSFSRIFTAAFFQVLAGMFAVERGGGEGLRSAAENAARLLVDAVQASPVVPSFYSQVAASMIAAEAGRFEGVYSAALKSGFVEHGILSREAAISLTFDAAARWDQAEREQPGDDLPTIRLRGGDYGLAADVVVSAAAQPMAFAVSGSTPDVGSVEPQPHDFAARSFVEDLIRRGRIDVDRSDVTAAAVVSPLRRKTHVLRRDGDGLLLERLFFDCGFPD
jgi:hypothetical protein